MNATVLIKLPPMQVDGAIYDSVVQLEALVVCLMMFERWTGG